MTQLRKVNEHHQAISRLRECQRLSHVCKNKRLLQKWILPSIQEDGRNMKYPVATFNSSGRDDGKALEAWCAKATTPLVN